MDEKKNETELCSGCGTVVLNGIVKDLVEKLVGISGVVKKVTPKVIEHKVTPKVIEQKVTQKNVQELLVQKTKLEKTKGIFLVVGEEGTILTSMDGTTWTSRTFMENTNYESLDLTNVIYVKDTLVVTSRNRIIFTSPDGISWTPLISGSEEYAVGGYKGVTYGSGNFVIVGDFGNILTSTDAIHWSKWTSKNTGSRKFLQDVTYGNGTFVTVGAEGTILNSSDGISWEIRTSSSSWSSTTSGEKIGFYGVGYGNGTFVTVGSLNNNAIILTSSDGIFWTSKKTFEWGGSIRSSPPKTNLWDVTYGKGTFVTVGRGIILTSSDGTAWTVRGTSSNLVLSGKGVYRTLLSVTYLKGIFVAVGSYGTILTSTDGTVWNLRNSGTEKDLWGITYKE